MSTLAPVNLHFENSGEWHSLPEWAECFINVGKQIASADHSTSRIVTAIVVPTRAYCAAFVGLGLIVSDAAKRDILSQSVHFQTLIDLPFGSRVNYRPTPRKALKGVLQGEEIVNGKLHIRVRVHSNDATNGGGGLTYLVDESRALQVQPAKHSGKLPKKQGTENKRLANGFVDSLVGDADPVQLGLRSKTVCAIVGKKNALEHEIRQTPLSIHANGDCRAQGHLQDVLRVDRFVSGEQAYRSALVPVGASLPTDGAVNKVEMAVVFDGVAGFLKWGAEWPGLHQIVILDRTEHYFDDATSAISSRFSQNRSQVDAALPDFGAPAGGEVLTFREAIR